MSWLYRQTEPALWTVGYYTPEGRWEPESDHNTASMAAARVAQLNGGRSDEQEEDPMTEQASESRETMPLVPEYPKPPYQGTRLRPLRVEDQLWSDALEIATKRGEDGGVSGVIRRYLVRYVRRHRHLLDARKE